MPISESRRSRFLKWRIVIVPMMQTCLLIVAASFLNSCYPNIRPPRVIESSSNPKFAEIVVRNESERPIIGLYCSMSGESWQSNLLGNDQLPQGATFLIKGLSAGLWDIMTEWYCGSCPLDDPTYSGSLEGMPLEAGNKYIIVVTDD